MLVLETSRPKGRHSAGGASKGPRGKVATRDGAIVTLRPATSDDESGLVEMLSALSVETIVLRYGAPIPFTGETARREAARLVGQLGRQHITLVMTRKEDGAESIVAVGEVARESAMPHVGEIAFLVRDDYQQRGLGRVLVTRLAEAARDAGMTMLRAEVRGDNRVSQRLIASLGQVVLTTLQHSQLQLLVRLDPSDDTRAATGLRPIVA